jgi:hypothetical protein
MSQEVLGSSEWLARHAASRSCNQIVLVLRPRNYLLPGVLNDPRFDLTRPHRTFGLNKRQVEDEDDDENEDDLKFEIEITVPE